MRNEDEGREKYQRCADDANAPNNGAEVTSTLPDIGSPDVAPKSAKGVAIAGSSLLPVSSTNAVQVPELGRAGGAIASVPLPRSITMRLPVSLRPAMQILAARPPVIAGQSVDNYLALLKIAVDEWAPQTFQECALLKQQVDAEWEILALQQVQTWLVNSAIGSEFLEILSAEEDTTHSSEHREEGRARRWQWKNLIFGALAGHAEAVEYLEKRTGRGVGISPDTAAEFVPMMPAYAFADRAITTRLARRDVAYRELSRIKAERSGRIADHRLNIADIRSHLSLPDYIRALIEVDLLKQAEPELYAEQLLLALRKRTGATGETGATDPVSAHAPVETTLSPGEQFMQELKKRRAETGAEPVSVHAPVTTTSAPSSPSESDQQDDVAGED